MNQLNSFVNQFNQFKQMFSGDPQAQIQQMLNSGRITQAQYNSAVQQANQLYKMIHGGRM